MGFTFNPRFTDQNTACMIIGEDIYAMLLVGEFLKTFTANKKISDAKRSTEVITVLHVDSRNAVDAMIQKTITTGWEFRKA